MNVKETLIKAREFIAKGWTQGSLARDARGESVYEKSLEAVCWCAMGALYAATPTNVLDHRDALFVLDRAGLGFGAIACYNDSTCKTQEDALAWFDRAIESVP